MEISLENCMWVFRWYWRARIIMQYLLPVVFMHQTSRFWCQAIYHAMKLWIYEIGDITGRAVIRNFSSSVENYFKILFFLLYKHQWNTKSFHSNSFWYERQDLLCSHSKGDIFTCEDSKFSRESSRVYNKPILWPAPSWLVSLIGRALHRYCRGQGFESCPNLNFFQAFFSQLQKLRV